MVFTSRKSLKTNTLNFYTEAQVALHAQMSFSFATHSVRVVSRNVGYNTEENGSVEVKAKKLQESEGEREHT